MWFELVKVISHQSVIIWFQHGVRQNSAAVERKSEKCRECTAGHLWRNVNDISSITPAKLNDNRHHVWSTTASPSKQRRHHWVDPDECDQQVISYYTLSTEIHLTSFERWTEFQKQWIECAHTNGHRHSLKPYLHHRIGSPILRTIND